MPRAPSGRSSPASRSRVGRSVRFPPRRSARACAARRGSGRRCECGKGVGMYKVIWLVKFRADMERDEVLRWWRGHHGDVAAQTPGMVRYVQNHWVAPLDQATQLPVAGAEPRFDGHAEHWFESREAYERA